MESSNVTLASNVTETMKQTSRELMKIHSVAGSSVVGPVGGELPSWMKWTVVASAIIIAAACVTNTTYNIMHTDNNSKTEQIDSSVIDTTGVAPTDTIGRDSVHH